MKVAVVIALFAMLAVASAYYPANYYGWSGYPYYAGAVHAAGSYYGWPSYNGWGNGYPYYFNHAAADKVDAAPVAPAQAPVADSAAPAAAQ